MAITTIEDLREHLQWAIELEHSTMPPYMCALYSLKPGTNQEVAEVLTSVVIEEMLHMTLAANLLNAVGGSPVLDRPGFIPSYPTCLPHSAESFVVPLAPFTPDTLAVFMKIEKPEEHDAPPEDDHYHTIGQFYRAIEDGFRSLCGSLGERAVFTGDGSRQITPDAFDYTGSGRIIAVTDLASALAAIEEIEEQGEGLKHTEVWDGDRDMFHPVREEVAHYFRFVEVRDGRWFQRGDTPASGPTGDPFAVDWTAVYPVKPGCRTQDCPDGSSLRERMVLFNATYCGLLRDLQRAFNGDPWHLYAAMPAMLTLRTLARELMQTPVGDGPQTACPSFEYVAAAQFPPATC